MKNLIAITFFFILFAGCESKLFDSSSKDNSLLSSIKGTWINSDNTNDTLYFNNDSIFTKKSIYDGVRSIFKYSIKKDSITIRYIGPNKILVPAVTNYMTLEDNKMTVYLKNCEYAFDCKTINYLKH
jgi:hypothetical protein